MNERDPQLERTAVVGIARALRNTSFYATDHPAVRGAVDDASATVSHLLEGAPEFVLKVVDGELVANDRPLFDAGQGTANLTGACLRRGIESIAFGRGLQPDEMALLIGILSDDPAEVQRRGGAADCLVQSGARHIVIDRLHTDVAPRDARPVDDVARECYATAIDALRAAAQQAGRGIPPDIEPVRQVVSETIDVIFRDQSAMLGLVAVKGRDEYTFTHALHICILCLEVGHMIGLRPDELEELGICALLHDLGKIRVPLPILRKPTALDPEEFAIVRRHPLQGAILLSRQANIPATASLVAFEHHRHCDGTGYPELEQPHQPCFYSLIVGPADVYDALTTDRPYRSAMTPCQALEQMQRQASHFEPRLFACFCELLGPYPAGSLVRLSDGRRAVVVRTDPRQPLLPWVRVVEDGPPHLGDEEISLSQDAAAGLPALSVSAVLDPADEGLDVCVLMGGSSFCTE